MKKWAFGLLLLGVMAGCAKTSSAEKKIDTVVSGEMLFSGPNSLQAAVYTSTEALAKELQIEALAIKSIGISGIQVTLAEDQAAIAESLLLQIVSNNNEMMALGSLSPLASGMSFELQVAEEVDLLPFLEDAGATWVLDVNLSEDIMDEMQASIELSLTVNYKN